MAYNQETITGFRFHNFMKQIGRGVRSNLYLVDITLPQGIQGSEKFEEKFRFLCRSASAPGFTLGVAEAYHLGRRLALDGDRTFEDWTVGVYLDQEGAVSDVLERWQDAIDGTVLADTSRDPANIDYFATADVMHLDKNGKVLKQYQLEGIWPTQIGPVELAFDSNDQIATRDVTFAVNWVEAINITRNNTTSE